MSHFTRKKFAKALVKMSDQHDLKSIAQAGAQTLVSQRRVRDLDIILKEVAEELWSARRHLEITVTTARPLAQSLKARIVELFRQRQAQVVAVTENIDPTMLGGIKIASPLGELDASVLTQLNNLKKHAHE